MSAAGVAVSLVPLVAVTSGVWALWRFYLRKRQPRPPAMRSLVIAAPLGTVFLVAAWAYAAREPSVPAFIGACLYTAIWIAAFLIGYRRRAA